MDFTDRYYYEDLIEELKHLSLENEIRLIHADKTEYLVFGMVPWSLKPSFEHKKWTPFNEAAKEFDKNLLP